MPDTCSDGKGLLQTIIEEPEADDLRLLYADWLEDNGEPERAELIRVQCEFAKHQPDADGFYKMPYTVGGLNQQETRLLKKAQRWLNEDGVPGLWESLVRGQTKRIAGNDCTWHRGFVEQVSVREEYWLQHGPSLVGLFPLRRVRLRDRRPHHTQTTSFPWMWTCVGGILDGLPHAGLSRELCTTMGFREWKMFETEKLALEAASQACLAFAGAR